MSFHSISSTFISILSSHLHLRLPSGFFPVGFPTKSLRPLGCPVQRKWVYRPRSHMPVENLRPKHLCSTLSLYFYRPRTLKENRWTKKIRMIRIIKTQHSAVIISQTQRDTYGIPRSLHRQPAPQAASILILEYLQIQKISFACFLRN
jgi:hypothetical protein